MSSNDFPAPPTGEELAELLRAGEFEQAELKAELLSGTRYQVFRKASVAARAAKRALAVEIGEGPITVLENGDDMAVFDYCEALWALEELK